MKRFIIFLEAFFHILFCGIVSISISATICIVGFASLVYLNQISPIEEIVLVLSFVSVFMTAVTLSGLVADYILKNKKLC